MDQQASRFFTIKILIGMGLGILVGLVSQLLPPDSWLFTLFVNQICLVLGQLFLNALKMLVVPLVLCSLVCGSASIGDFNVMGRIGVKSLSFYLMTTAIAITLALLIANFFDVGSGLKLVSSAAFNRVSPPSVLEVIANLIPKNPIDALAQGNMLQIVVFSILLGLAAIASGNSGQKVVKGFIAVNDVMMRLIIMVISLAPYGVFFLLVVQFSQLNWQAIMQLLGYFCCVLLVLFLQMALIYSLFLGVFQQINPITFFKRLYGLLVFAFSTSSSVASIPVTLETVTKRLGVNHRVASFVIPLGATINMDGTAIMQGVATVFIAHLYHIDLSFLQYITVIAMATLASIGTAGVPGVGLITLIMVLEQVGLPTDGIAMIIGVDRLLDMARTAVNVSGDAMIACLVAGSEGQLDEDKMART
ncbi:MAG: dicarboxylate/amino acid:cation symporter [Legionellales bacterium]|nr:dicarboxylate/amino acid:cation symporter [Legionellales bacterium]HAG62366.1 dicarboxylate/amino acid:cation symporter [Coxiellaceae bacterium]